MKTRKKNVLFCFGVLKRKVLGEPTVLACTRSQGANKGKVRRVLSWIALTFIEKQRRGKALGGLGGWVGRGR